MRFAATLRTDVVILRAGRIPPESDQASLTRLVEALTAIGVYGDRVGVRPALQTVDCSPQDLSKLLGMLPEHTVGVDLNPSGLITASHSPREAVELLGPHVLHVHACDAVRDVATRQAIEVELGRGSADFPEILGRLTEFDYRGWVTIERRESPDPISDIENAVEYLRSL
jgi:sugar phosphate isomerase/epimerase